MTALAAVSWQEAWSRRFYHSRPGWIDGTREFLELIRDLAPPGGRVLDFGCGPGNRTSEFLGGAFARADGLDVDPDARFNPHLRRVDVYHGGAWPVPPESYDAVVADYVLEHLDRPAETMRQLARALKPGGLFLFRTPNLWHYVAIFSAATPHRLHLLLANRLRRRAAGSHDPYPTRYRINTPRAVRSLCRGAELEEVELRMIEKNPSYGMASRALFLTFLFYERLVNAFPGLSRFRANILGAFRKPQA